MSRLGRRAYVHADQLPLITPDSDWVAPAQVDWPDLSKAKYVAFDCETQDTNLNELGPGFIRRDAQVCGFSFATELGHKLYLPIGHADGNVDRDAAIRYAKDALKRVEQEKVGANIMYDVEACWSLGIDVKGRWRDIQVAEPLLDENAPEGYSLEVLSKSYLGHGKNERLLREAGAAYGADVAGNPKKIMARLAAKYVGPYGEDDAADALAIYFKQLERLKLEDLMPIFELESDLTPVLWRMRLRGVKVNLEAAEKLVTDTKKREEELYAWLEREAKWNFNPNAQVDMVRCLSARGLKPLTKLSKRKGGDVHVESVTNEHLIMLGGVDKNTGDFTGDEFCANLYEYRVITKMRKDFIEGSILLRNVDGRLHPSWHQLRDFDEEAGRGRGTRSGRVAASKPNLTNQPARHKVWGPRIRGLFVADQGRSWIKRDYSQQEPRLLLHFAYVIDQLPRHRGGRAMPGAAEARQRYIDDPNTDYHQMTKDLILLRSGKDLNRRDAKDINLGGAYGMGFEKLMTKLNIDAETCKEILKAYHLGVPFVKLLEKYVTERAAKYGFIKTILGRKRRFDKWEDRRAPWDDNYEGGPARSYEAAVERWGELWVGRADVRKALNALVQGSAGDQIKKALVIMDAEGFEPQIQVYDEINESAELDPVRMKQADDIMMYCLNVTVPHSVEPDVGPDWGHLETYKYALAA
jgi:DNA polymerase I-like protein with 3'-5' exonuclease and polymerase domains